MFEHTKNESGRGQDGLFKNYASRGFIRLVTGLLERKSRRSRARLICIFRLSEQGPVRKLAARKYSVKAFKAKSEKLQNIKKISAQSNPPP